MVTFAFSVPPVGVLAEEFVHASANYAYESGLTSWIARSIPVVSARMEILLTVNITKEKREASEAHLFGAWVEIQPLKHHDRQFNEE